MSTVLVLRTCAADMTSYGGFRWPTSGAVSCPDWDVAPRCGGGLHGLLWGEGDGALMNWDPEARWLVVEVDEDRVVAIGPDKVKFPAGTVVFCGERLEATAYLREHGGAGRAIVGGTATAGYRGTATAGDGGTATAGDRGTATAGDGGTATAGYRGTATAGHGGTATAGDRGTATAGDRGTATAGDGGTVAIKRWDFAAERYRLVVGYIGEDGLLPGVSYRLNDAGTLVAVENAAVAS